MSITLGYWIVPVALTLLGIVATTSYRPSGHYDFGGALLALFWMGVAGAAWLMWLLSWFF